MHSFYLLICELELQDIAVMVYQFHSRGYADKQGSDSVFFGFFIYRHDGAARMVVNEAGEKGEVAVLAGSQGFQDILMGGKDIGRTFSHSASLQAQG
jgi:hypothetical protein